MAANLFTGATNSNWGTGGNWSTLAVPTASDGNVATFSALSPDCTVDTSDRVCNAIDFTGYTGTITFTKAITVSGSCTLGSGMHFAGASGLLGNATGTWTANGVTCPQPLTWSGTATYTISGTWTNSGLVTLAGTTLTTTVNGSNLDCSAGLTIGGSTPTITGTAAVRMIGTGTITNPSGTSGHFRINLVINTAGTVTFSSTGSFAFDGATLTYTAGTVVTTSTTLLIQGAGAATTTLNTNGITWNAVKHLNNTHIVALTSDLTLTGLLTLNSGGTVTTNGPGVVNCSGGIDLTNNSTKCDGTAKLNVTGGTITNSTGTGVVRCSMDLNGNVTIGSANPFRYDTGTLTYVSGTITTTSTTFTVIATTTLNTSGVSWNIVNISGTATITLSSSLTANGLLTVGGTTLTTTINTSDLIAHAGFTHAGTTSIISGTSALRLTGTGTYTGTSSGRNTLPISLEASVTFAGANGIDTNTLSSTVAALTHTLVAGNTYRVRTALTLKGASGSTTALLSGTSSSAAFLTLDNAANQSVRYIVATDIDSSGGEPIHDYRGTLLRTVNWDTQEAAGVQHGLGSALSRLRPSPCL